MSFWSSPKSLAVAALLLLSTLAVAPLARAFTAADAADAFAAYQKAFYFTSNDAGYYRKTTAGGKTFFWDRAEQLEMLLDVYERAPNSQCLALFSNVFNGFIADHGRDWRTNDFNDDIMWMVIACARAHQLTGNSLFRDLAKANFDLCYARAWSTNMGGGLWWKTSNTSKNACVNGPGSIAASLLYQIYGDASYLDKARAMFDWERATLFDPATGRICDNTNLNGRLSRRAFTYNEGTFIGAANFLGFTNEARLAADYTMNHLCANGILPAYGQNGDAGGFNGICARWLAKFMTQRGLQSSYLKWLQANADAAWKDRRSSDNLSWCRWNEPTPDIPLYSWACSSAIVVLHVVPPSQ